MKTSTYNAVSSSTVLFSLISDLCGYVRSLLGVEDAIFNLIPIARSFGIPEEIMNQLTECWDDESKQLDRILQYWSRKKNVAKNLDSLRRDLEKLKQGLLSSYFSYPLVTH